MIITALGGDVNGRRLVLRGGELMVMGQRVVMAVVLVVKVVVGRGRACSIKLMEMWC